MVKVFCDRCGCDCDLNAYALTIQVIHNPTPANVASNGEARLTDDNTHISLCLCQKCYNELKLPNIYSTTRSGNVVWDNKCSETSGVAQPNSERSISEKSVKPLSHEFSSR